MDVDEAKTVGALLRKSRFKRDMTLEQVAGLAGISAGSRMWAGCCRSWGCNPSMQGSI